jgi:hypothetical protein
MQLVKSIDTTVTYHPLETYWWMNNNISPSSWDKSGIVVPKKKFQKFFESLAGSTFGVTYRTQNKKLPFQKYLVNGTVKIDGESNNGFLFRVKYGVETKKELTVDIELLWDPKYDSNAEKIVKELSKMVVYNAEKTQVYMVIQDDTGLDLRPFDINIPELDIELNYGKEWAEKHDYLLEVLSRENKKGIALLHGLPGTGKSMYIRYLISLLAENRTLIYLPNQLIQSITDPGFLPLMAEYPNSILIIEDAEEAIKSRKTGGATVDKLLNLSDGIISDFLGTQIICTFNNDLSMIDEALLRKGRLILKHEFKKLTIEQAQKLSDKLGFDTKINKEMTVSEVYNQEEKHSEDMKETQRIGFNASRVG